MKLYCPITIDLYRVYPLQVMEAQQGNVGRGAIVTLTAGSAVINPTDETTEVYVKKPDGTVSWLECSVEDGKIKIDFTNQMLMSAGVLQVELRMKNEDDDITTPIFKVKVNKSNVQSAGRSENELPLLDQIKKNAEDAKAAAGKLSEENADLTERIETLEQNGTGTGGIVSTEYIDYDVICKTIRHRGYNTIAPENTIPAFVLAKQKGDKYVETDVCLTSDGIPVILHDSTIDRTSDGTGNIANMTYAEVLQYDFGSWKSSKYTGTKIPTFEEFIKMCRCVGLCAYVEVKHNASFTEEQVKSLVDIVKKYAMNDKISWISQSVSYLEYIKNYEPTARLIYSPQDITESSIATGLTLKTDSNEVVVNVSYTVVTPEKVAMCIENDFPLEIYVVDTQSIVESMNPYVTGVTSNNLVVGKILYEMFNSDYKIPCTGITLDQSELVFTSVGSKTIRATVEPENTTDLIMWSSNATNVATVNGGIVTAKSNGSATITAKCGTYMATCTVNVSGIEENVPIEPETTELAWIVGRVGAVDTTSYRLGINNARAAYVALKGDTPIVDNSNKDTEYYPIKIPEGASGVSIVSPDHVCSVNECQLSNGKWTKIGDSGWLTLGGETYTFTTDATHIVVNIKYGTAGTTQIASIPDNVVVAFV